jgi:hypothetical protein
MDDSDNDSDDWAKDDLPELQLPVVPSSTEQQNHKEDDVKNENDDDDGWELKIVSPTNPNIVDAKNDGVDVDNNSGGEPMIVVNMTTMSQLLSLPEIHCQFDPNSVNDVVAVQTLRRRIENEYNTYSKHMEYISDRVIIPCGSSVYRSALIELRKDHPGQYFYPIFPSKK